MSSPYPFDVVLADIQAMQQDRISDLQWAESQAKGKYDEACDRFDEGQGSYSAVLEAEAQWYDAMAERQQAEQEAL